MKNYIALSASTVSVDSDLVVAVVQVTPVQSPYDNVPAVIVSGSDQVLDPVAPIVNVEKL